MYFASCKPYCDNRFVRNSFVPDEESLFFPVIDPILRIRLAMRLDETLDQACIFIAHGFCSIVLLKQFQRSFS